MDTEDWAERLLDSLSPREQELARARRVRDLLPTLSVQRGGLTYQRLTEEQVLARDRYQEALQRVIAARVQAREAAIRAAVEVGNAEGWDIHLHIEPPYRAMRNALGWHPGDDPLTFTPPRDYIGIEYQPARYGMPVLVQHHYDATDDWEDDL